VQGQGVETERFRCSHLVLRNGYLCNMV